MPRATLAERKDKRYRCKYKGKEFYGKSQTEAFAKREAYIDLLKQGLRFDSGNMTVLEYSAKWLPTHRSDVKKRTYNTYAHYLDVANEIIVFYHSTTSKNALVNKLIILYGKTGFDELRRAKKLQFLPMEILHETAIEDL